MLEDRHMHNITENNTHNSPHSSRLGHKPEKHAHAAFHTHAKHSADTSPKACARRSGATTGKSRPGGGGQVQ